MSSIFYFIEFLIIVVFVNICNGYEHNELDDSKVNFQWFPAIFRIPHTNASKDEYEYQCLGVFVHTKAVLASASCVPAGMKDVTSVRFYEWKDNPKITKQTLYQERNLSEVLDFRTLYPGDIGNDYVHILVLSESVSQHYSKAIVPSITAYTDIRNYLEREYHEMRCVFVTTEGNMNDGINIKHAYINSEYKLDCCDDLGISKDDTWNWSGYRLYSNCGSRLFEKTCFQITDQNLFAYRDPLICPDLRDNPYLHGFVVKVNNKIVEFSNFEENKPWISEYLRKL